MNLGYIAAICALAVFFLIVMIAVLRDRKQQKEKGIEIPEGEWLFSDWDIKLYDALTKKAPEQMAKTIGMKPDEYLYSCELLQVKPDLKEVIVRRLIGIAIIPVSLIIYLFTDNIFIAIIGLLAGAALAILPGQGKLSMAKKRKAAMVEELPRFLDLLQTALYVDMPIEKAITTTASHLKGTILSEEFETAMSDVRLGAYDWKTALEQIANRYEIDDFSDFVMDLTISYDKGMNIYQMVSDRSADLKKTNLLVMKEHASKLSSTMIVPIVIFKLLPLLAIMLIPIILQFQNGLF